MGVVPGSAKNLTWRVSNEGFFVSNYLVIVCQAGFCDSVLQTSFVSNHFNVKIVALSTRNLLYRNNQVYPGAKRAAVFETDFFTPSYIFYGDAVMNCGSPVFQEVLVVSNCSVRKLDVDIILRASLHRQGSDFFITDSVSCQGCAKFNIRHST